MTVFGFELCIIGVLGRVCVPLVQLAWEVVVAFSLFSLLWLVYLLVDIDIVEARIFA